MTRPRPPGRDLVRYYSIVEAVRIDKWLWAARFFKTRSAATEAVAGGRVTVNDARVKPAREVRPGDTVEVRKGPVQWTVTVLGVADKRGSATVASGLYEETAASADLRERRAAEQRMSRPLGADLDGRPTKQARRRLDDVRRQARGGGRDTGR